MPSSSSHIRLFTEKMQAENLPEIFINSFKKYYQKLLLGETGLISEKEIRAINSLPDSENLPPQFFELGQQHLTETVFLKLNGGLGTSMGLGRAKSLLTVKDDLTFLDIIARQTERGGFKLLLMDSYSTQQDSLNFLKKYPAISHDLPLDFLQHKAPKVSQADLRPVSWPPNPKLEWCPAGHGDLYLSIFTSGVLDSLLQKGFRYTFISNADNLGAVLDPRILGYFISQKYSFMLEVTERSEADKKGGHLAQYPDGRLLLREIAQCPEQDRQAFQDINYHRYFNTNNLWIDLRFLKNLLLRKKYHLELPMIRNEKTVDPRDSTSPPVYQIETAVGSAIAVFEGASAIRVPRTRFSPVKNSNDLLAVRSDLYKLDADFQITPNSQRIHSLPEIELDEHFFRKIDDFEKRFQEGIPSLLKCEQLTIQGDIFFGKNVTLKGRVSIKNKGKTPAKIADDRIIQGDLIL
jgi:UTP--glucose-1-phosphate uridylyltransferase